jgi:hypothetical protein
MEFYSETYRLLYSCEKLGMKMRAWDLATEEQILEECLNFLKEERKGKK